MALEEGMRKEIHLEDFMRILNRYKQEKVICKRITRHQREQQVIDCYYLKQNSQKAEIYNDRCSFMISLEGIGQLCCDTGKNYNTREAYVLLTVAYGRFQYVSLGIVCQNVFENSFPVKS